MLITSKVEEYCFCLGLAGGGGGSFALAKRTPLPSRLGFQFDTLRQDMNSDYTNTNIYSEIVS